MVRTVMVRTVMGQRRDAVTRSTIAGLPCATDRRADRRAGRQADRQIGRQAGRQVS